MGVLIIESKRKWIICELFQIFSQLSVDGINNILSTISDMISSNDRMLFIDRVSAADV